MSKALSPTTVAIILGSAVGVIAALTEGTAPRRGNGVDTSPTPRPVPTRTEPALRAPTAPAESAPFEPRAISPIGNAPDAPSAPAPPPSSRPPAPREAGSAQIAELELGCARRQPAACLAAARAHENTPDPAKARLHRSLAVSLLDERCLARDAESCHELAELYRAGIGVEQNLETASALDARTTQLCAGKTTGFCAAPPPAGD